MHLLIVLTIQLNRLLSKVLKIMSVGSNLEYYTEAYNQGPKGTLVISCIDMRDSDDDIDLITHCPF